LWREATPVGVNVAEAVIGFVQDRNQGRRLDNLPRLRLHVELRDTHRHAIRVRIVLAVCGHPILSEFRGPRRQRQPPGKVGTDVPKRGKRRRFRIGRKRRRLSFDRDARGSTIRETSKLWRRGVTICSHPVTGEVGCAVRGVWRGSIDDDAALSVARRTGLDILRPLRRQRY